MLRIRPEHISALAVQQQESFTARMVIHLREVFPSEVAALDDRKLRMLVEKVCGRAAEWRITEESHVERLLELFVNFEQLRRTRLPEQLSEIVQDPDRPGAQVIDLLEDRLLFAER